jgi:hypothetical protein
MPDGARHMALLRPAAVAVHDDGYVVGDGGHSFCVEMSSLTSEVVSKAVQLLLVIDLIKETLSFLSIHHSCYEKLATSSLTHTTPGCLSTRI